MTPATAIFIAGLSVCPAAVVNDAPRHSYVFQTCYMVGTKASAGLAPMTVAEGVAKIKAARKSSVKRHGKIRCWYTRPDGHRKYRLKFREECR